MSIGTNLKRLLDARGISAVELAFRSGHNPETIYRWLRDDRDPSLASLRLIADVLGCEPGDIIAEQAV